MPYKRAGDLIARLEGEIAGLLGLVEAAEGPRKIPSLGGRDRSLLRLPRQVRDVARRRLGAPAKAERGEYEAKVTARGKHWGRAKGKHPKPPDQTPGPNEQSNPSGPNSRVVRKSRNHEYRQAYTAQAVVDAKAVR